MSSIRFLRVTGIRGKNPGVLVSIANQFVRWGPRRGWECECLTPDDEYECEHIMTIQNMLDEKVTTPVKWTGK